MTEEQREEAFPIHIELGRKMPKIEEVMEARNDSGKIYPTLYLSNVKGLEDLPEEGCMLVDFKRGSMTVHRNKDGKTTCSVEIECRTICLQDEDGDEDDIVDYLFKKQAKKKALEENTEDDDEDSD